MHALLFMYEEPLDHCATGCKWSVDKDKFVVFGLLTCKGPQ